MSCTQRIMPISDGQLPQGGQGPRLRPLPPSGGDGGGGCSGNHHSARSNATGCPGSARHYNDQANHGASTTSGCV
jgi:hypothetical protein